MESNTSATATDGPPPPEAAPTPASESGPTAAAGNGEGTSSSAPPLPPPLPATAASAAPGRRPTRRDRTLDDVMRGPSTTLPGVVVLDGMPDGINRKETLDPKEDLWLSTADGRYSSPVIPLHVGVPPYMETFYVHKHVLLKSEYFERALCGDFKESGSQSVDLPEESPAIFHFLVAYLYEGKYNPIKPAASVLVPDQDKGKAKEGGQETGADSDSDDSMDSYGSDASAQSRRRRERRRRREDRHFERMRQKRPGAHRPNCGCPQCLSVSGPPCWHCQAPRVVPPVAPLPHHPNVVIDHREMVHTRGDRQRRPPRRRHGVPAPPPMTPPVPGGWTAEPVPRISGEDLRTWLLAYELNVDVYILANKFLLEGFKKEIARVAIDMLETAGPDAAVPQVLFLCKKLFEGLPENDNLLKMIFARVGFLQPWRHAPDETQGFLLNNPEIASLLLREMAARREDDPINGRALPSMERPWYPPPGLDPVSPYRPTHYHPYRGPPRW